MTMMRSTYARRRGTGRRPHHVRIRRKPVHIRRHRRMKGIRTQPKGASARNRAKALALVAKRQAARKRAQPARTALLRKNARATALRNARAHVRPHKKRRFLGRKYKGRHVPKGLHRKFNGRKPSTKPRVRKIPPKPKVTAAKKAITPQSYISMF